MYVQIMGLYYLGYQHDTNFKNKIIQNLRGTLDAIALWK